MSRLLVCWMDTNDVNVVGHHETRQHTYSEATNSRKIRVVLLKLRILIPRRADAQEVVLYNALCHPCSIVLHHESPLFAVPRNADVTNKRPPSSFAESGLKPHSVDCVLCQLAKDDTRIVVQCVSSQ